MNFIIRSESYISINSHQMIIIIAQRNLNERIHRIKQDAVFKAPTVWLWFNALIAFWVLSNCSLSTLLVRSKCVWSALWVLWLISDLERWRLTALDKLVPDRQTDRQSDFLGSLSEPKKDPGQKHLWGPSYGRSKRATVRGIWPNLTDIAHPCWNACFSGLEGSFWEIQKPRINRRE